MARRIIALTVVVLLSTIVSAQADSPSELIVVLRTRSSVGPRTLKIGDIADLSGGTPALREAVAALDLTDGPTPRAGITIKRQQVSFRIRLAEVPDTLFRVEGAPESWVEAEA